MTTKEARPYDKRCLDALSVARAFIKREAPYYSTIVYGLIPHFIDGIHTLAVSSNMSLLIDPKWFVEMEKETGHIQGMSRDEAAYRMQAGVLVHEANHILRGLDRIEALARGGTDKQIINMGFDIPINNDLLETGWLLPAWAVTSKKFGFPDGLTGEQYVELLLKEQEKNLQKYEKMLKNLGCGSDQQGSGGSVTSGKCGSCAGNGLDSHEQAADAEAGRPKADQQRLRKEALGQIREAASSAGRGTLPQSLKELLGKSEKKPVIPWRTRLRRTIRRASGQVQVGRADFSMRRPSKRSYTRGILRPGMIDKKPEIFCIEDSSGSMGPDQLRSVRAEIRGVFNQLGISEMWFCDIDAGVSVKPRRIRLNDLDRLPVHGRGGTDFRPGIALAKSLLPKPDILIYLTDGDGVAPPHPPKNVTVVWCIVPTPHGRRPARWGELVVVSDDQELLDPYEVNDYDR
jgi:predicted metal-dependent peptidase